MFRLSVRAPHCIDKTAKCPESLCPVSALPLLEDVRSIPARTLLPGRRSYGLIRQSHLALLAFGLGLVQEVFAGCYQLFLAKITIGCRIKYINRVSDSALSHVKLALCSAH